MKKIIRLTEADLTKIIERTINEIREDNPYDQLKKFLEDRISFEGYNFKRKVNNKFTQLYGVFEDEYGHEVENNMKRRVNNPEEKALIEWLKGLPSSIDLPYNYYEMSNLLYALGFDEVKEMEDDELSDFYYSIVADTILENK
jgi:hypothetical protein